MYPAEEGEMACKEEACPECTNKCLLFHKRKKNSISSITSFFKVMIGDNYSEMLFLPPKFARTVSMLVDQKTHLEDSRGQQWEVTVSNLNGSLAFLQGWHAFALDHHLELGDFAVFRYVAGSHFIVDIYDKTGCEKPEISENIKQKKITRTKRNPIAKDGTSHTIDKGSMNERVSSTSVASGSDNGIIQSQCDVTDARKVPAIVEKTSNCETSNRKLQPVSRAEFMEEPYYMIDRDLGCKQVEYRSPIFDLSNFEMQNNESGADNGKKNLAACEKSPCYADKLIISRSEAGIADEDPAAQAVGSKIQMTEKNKDSELMDKIQNKDSCNNRVSKSLEEPREKGKISSDLGNEGLKESQTAEIRSSTHSKKDKVVMLQKEYASFLGSDRSVRQKIAGVAGSSECPGIVGMQNRQSGDKMKGLKKECEEMTSEMRGHEEMIEQHVKEQPQSLKDNDEILKVVKTEAVDSVGLPQPLEANLSCFVPADNPSFLELPACLPTFSHKGRTKMERKVVLLRDPVARVWPILYHEKQGFKVLTSGWPEFSSENNIQPGDECIFMLENELEAIYSVRIVKK